MRSARIAAVVVGAVMSTVYAGAARAAEGPREVLLFDFETDAGRFENAKKLQYVAEHATQGQKAGKATLDKPFDANFGFWGNSNMAGKWAEFDQFVIDVFVEGGPVKCFGFVVSDNQMDWWKRYNYEFKLPPGKRRLAFSLGAFVKQGGQKPLDLAKLSFFAIRFASDKAGAAPTIYLDNARLVKGTGSFEVKVLYGFEGADAGKHVLEDWPPEFKGKSKMAAVAEHATEGTKALRLESRAPAGNVAFSGFEADWSRYDTLAMDVFSAADKPIKVSGWIKPDSMATDWWKRHNYERVLRPGFNSVKISVGGLTNPGNKRINVSNIVAFNIAVDRATIFIDNVRLVKGIEEIAVKGIRKFDFGPANSATMPGFTAASKSTGYSKVKGYGWMPGAQLGRDFDIMEMLGRHRPPDDLCRDFCQPTRATFAVDLPNGDYRVWVMLGPPGNGWGQWFKRRTVKAEGRTVVDEQYTAESFKKFEFQFEDAEDLPGDDLWTKYIDKLFRPSEFDVTVADGQLSLELDAQGRWWCTHLNGLVIYPKSEAAAGAKWLAGLSERRKEQYDSLHVEDVPAAPAPYAGVTPADTARGYVRFVHSPDRDIQVNSAPTAAEVKAALDLAATPGEYEAGCVGVWPLADCGRMKVTVSDLAGPGGASIPASAVQALVLRYKALNHDAIYTITPKYMDAVPPAGVGVRKGVTRSFWLVVHVPAGAGPGRYSGKVILTPEKGKADTVGLSLTVWPIELVEPDFPMGMFMMGPFVNYYHLSGGDDLYWREWKTVLDDARAHGMTSVDPLVDIPMKGAAGGKARVDFSKMDRFMELARGAGFKQELNGYGIGTGFRYRNCHQSDAEAKKFGLAKFADLVRVYFDAVREHSKRKNWLPICFCTDDEYIVHPGSTPEKLAELHRVMQDNAPGFRFVAFDSTRGQSPAQAKMLADIDTWGAGIHTPWVSETVRKAKRRLWLYNTGMNRFTFGAYMFFARKKHDVKGFFQWVYPGVGTYTPHYLASHREAHYGVVYPSTRGLRTTVTWERLRAGCDDHRYLETATRLIAKAKRSGRGAREAKALEATIGGTIDRLQFGKGRADAFDGVGRAENPLTPESMERFRRAVAEGTIALQRAMR